MAFKEENDDVKTNQKMRHQEEGHYDRTTFNTSIKSENEGKGQLITNNVSLHYPNFPSNRPLF